MAVWPVIVGAGIAAFIAGLKVWSDHYWAKKANARAESAGKREQEKWKVEKSAKKQTKDELENVKTELKQAQSEKLGIQAQLETAKAEKLGLEQQLARTLDAINQLTGAASPSSP